MKKIWLIALILSSSWLQAENVEYSLVSRMAQPVGKVTFDFVYPVNKGQDHYTIGRYSASQGPFYPNQPFSWHWENTQSSGYDGWPYKITVEWQENGKQQKAVTCFGMGNERWKGDADFVIQPHGKVTGTKRLSGSPSINFVGPSRCKMEPCDLSGGSWWSDDCCSYDPLCYWPESV